jgi:riboflavin-specific deaminase-like protein
MEIEPLRPGSPLAAAEVVRDIDFRELAPVDRPYLVLNMVTTVDGRATLEGRTRALGNAADKALFQELRTVADAVMVGARTASIENYGRLVRDAGRRERRRERGLNPDPLAVVVSARLSVSADIPLLQDPASRVVIVTDSDGTLEGCTAAVEYVRTGSGAELAPAFRTLRETHGIRSILCEGGPSLNAALLREGLVDELFLTVAATLSGESMGPGIVAALPRGETKDLTLRSVLRGGDDLLLRYAFSSSPA